MRSKHGSRANVGRLLGGRALWLAGAWLFFSAPVTAQEKPAKGVITLAEVTIVGRIQKPIASVDVNRIQPKLTLQELRQPFLDKIEQVLYQDPF
jgi:hypothetical protein